jgi:diguanylate cyclase (GGDEF)-like protein
MTDTDKVVSGLASGADDYLTKPFHAQELLARLGVGRRVIDLHRQIEAKNRLLEEMALTDPLTGLPNRRAVEVWAARQLNGAARHGFSFWVVMADLDGFKSVNDTYGHDAGDAVLKKFAEVLSANTRSSNICARLGGEEFLSILTHAEKENVEAAVGRVRQQFAAQEFKFQGRNLSVTASFGIAGFRGEKAPDFKLLMKQADAALYSAKTHGRNRIEFSKG